MESMNCFYFWKNNGLLIGYKTIYKNVHQHPNLQLFISLNQDQPLLLCNGYWKNYNSVIVDFDVLHQFDSQKHFHAILFIDPLSESGRKVRKSQFQNSNIQSINFDVISDYIDDLKKFTDTTFGKERFHNTFDKIVQALICKNQPDEPYDERIESSLKILLYNTRSYLSVNDLAKSVEIPEVKYRHLFREQTGVSIRRYLLWQRTIKALIDLKAGKLNLNTIHEGSTFYDPEHFKQTFEGMFGIIPNQILDDNESLKVVEVE
jgi:AraC-like DNA-binding protein